MPRGGTDVKAEKQERGTGLAGVGRALLMVAIAVALTVGGGGVANAQEEAPDEQGGLIGSVDGVLDGATCDGPLGFVLNDVVNCDPEDEPPFQSYENGGF